MNRNQQHDPAGALDAWLDTGARGPAVPAPEGVPPDEAALAAELTALAARTEADAAFVAQLERQLYSPRPAPGRSWSTLLNTLWRRPMFKRTLAAAATTAALLLVILMVGPRLNRQSGLVPLPSLALLTAYAAGGAAGASNPFPETEFILEAALPTTTGHVAVYRQTDGAPPTLADAQQWAARFGMAGDAYGAPDLHLVLPGAVTPPQTYTFFDGPRQLSVGNGAVSFLDRRWAMLAALPATPDAGRSEAQQVAAAEAFLQSYGLLDFAYRAAAWQHPAGTTIVQFYRILDGIPVEEPTVDVALTPDGQVASMNYRPQSLERLGEYPIRSAQEAWATLVSGTESGHIYYNYILEPAAAISYAPPRNTWLPVYRAGEEAHLYGAPLVYRPVEGDGAPRVELSGLLLAGAVAELEEETGHSLHVWGQVQADAAGEPVLAVAGWEALPAESPMLTPFNGTLRRAGDALLLEQAGGVTYLLPHAPADVPDGLEVSVSGRASGRMAQGYPVLDWFMIQSTAVAQSSAQSGAIVISKANAEPQADGETGPTATAEPAAETPPAPSGAQSGGGIAGAVPQRVELPAPRQFPHAPGETIEGVEGWLTAVLFERRSGGYRLQAYLVEKPLDGASGWTVWLAGDALAGIEAYDGLRVRVWGTYILDEERGTPTIVVTRYEPADPAEQIQGWLGTVAVETLADKEVAVLQTRTGERYVLASSLRFPGFPGEWRQMGERQVLVEGVVRSETFGGLLLIEDVGGLSWGTDIERLTEVSPEYLQPRPMVMPDPSAPLAGKATVEEVELAYFGIWLQARHASGNLLPQDALVVQPVWRFAGHLDNGDSFEVFVQAVRNEHLKP